jgi:hypothetical protein
MCLLIGESWTTATMKDLINTRRLGDYFGELMARGDFERCEKLKL